MNIQLHSATPVRFEAKTKPMTIERTIQNLKAMFEAANLPDVEVSEIPRYGMGVIIDGVTPPAPRPREIRVTAPSIAKAEQATQLLKSAPGAIDKTEANVPSTALPVMTELKAHLKANGIDAILRFNTNPQNGYPVIFVADTKYGAGQQDPYCYHLGPILKRLPGLSEVAGGDELYPMFSYKGQKLMTHLVGALPLSNFEVNGHPTEVSVSVS